MQQQVLLPDEKGRSFARALRVGNHLYMAGMTGQWNIETWEPLPEAVGDIGVQTHQIFKWMQQVLEHCGLGFEDVIKLTTFIRNIDDLPKVGEIRDQYLPHQTYVGSAIQVSGFIGTADLEIEPVAIYPE